MPRKTKKNAYGKICPQRNVHFFRPSATDLAISRVNYIRSLDLLIEFLDSADKVKELFGDKTPYAATSYKVVSRIALPWAKTAKSLYNAHRLKTGLNCKITFANLFNIADAFISSGSFIAGMFYTWDNDNTTAKGWEMALLATSLILHILKDHIENILTQENEDSFLNNIIQIDIEPGHNMRTY